MRRRTFLKLALGGPVVSYLDWKGNAWAEIVNQTLPPNIAIDVLRPEDLLNLRFEFINLKLNVASGEILERDDKSKEAYVIVMFPLQHLLERVVPDSGSSTPPPQALAGPSRLVFRLPKNINSIPYNFASLLSWNSWETSVAPTALPPQISPDQLPGAKHKKRGYFRGYALQLPKAGIKMVKFVDVGKMVFSKDLANSSFNPPGPLYTAIEAPTGLILSPHAYSAWAHAVDLFPNRSAAESPADTHSSPQVQSGPTTSAAAPDSAGSKAALSPSAAISSNPADAKVTRAASGVIQLVPQRTELWHTRMGVRDPDAPNNVNEQDYAELRTVRAISMPDYGDEASKYSKGAGVPCGTLGTPRVETLTQTDRYQIVHLTSDYTLGNYVKPVQANRLMLSPLGAWLDLRGDWIIPEDSDSDYSLESWIHKAAMGRDFFVRVVYKGYLFPFGHRASKIVVTERRLDSPGNFAYLRSKQFVVVREPEKSYPKDPKVTDLSSQQGRWLPFRTVKIKTLVTPTLDDSSKDDTKTNQDKNRGQDQETKYNWITMNNGQDFLFQLEAEDWDQRICEFTMPLAFICNTDAESPGWLNIFSMTTTSNYTQYVGKTQNALSLINSYLSNIGSKDKNQRNERPMSGQKISFAPRSDSGDASLETDTLVFGAGFRLFTEKGDLVFFPTVQKATIRLAAARQITGQDSHVTINLFQGFINNGFGPGNDKGEVFAKIAGTQKLDFPTSRAGGVASPNMNLRGLSRKFGVVGGGNDDDHGNEDLTKLAAGNPDQSYFTRCLPDAKLLGGIALGEIINPVFGDGGSNLPSLQTIPEYDADDNLKSATTSYVWNPTVKDSGFFKTDAATTLSIRTEIFMPFDGREPHSTTTGELHNFTLDFFGYGDPDKDKNLMELHFKSFSFVAKDKQKPDFSVSGVSMTFTGMLSFVQQLATIITGDEFQDPPSLDVTADGVVLGYSLSIPNIDVPPFELDNLAFKTALSLPFTGGPVDLRLAVAERNNPCTLTLGIFAGGAFFGINLGPDGLHNIEAAFEFGANLSLNLVVASGRAYMMAGIYFQMKGNEYEITGYIRCGGALQVLHLIAVSVQFLFKLGYEAGGMVGSGTVVVEIDIAFFSKDVEISITRRIDSNSSSASLDDGGRHNRASALNEEDDFVRHWASYCEALVCEGGMEA